MKVAFVQDWLVVNGGAEKVAKEIIHCFDDVTIFSLIDFLSDKDRNEILGGRKTTTSFLQKIPNVKNSYRNYFPLFPTAIESLNFSGFDLIISSSYAVAKGIKTTKNQTHICYCHSPIRYAWDLEDEYLSHVGFLKKIAAKLFLTYIRKWDVRTANRADYFLTNSNYVADRIQRIYNRESTVIYPPVDTTNFSLELKKDNYYFTSARLVAYKKTDIIVKAFADLPNIKLIVSGDGPELDKLQQQATKNVEFVGFVEKPKLINYMQKAKAFILAAEEDFGITSLEAQSCGTPVIAYKKGGYLETVIENKTGLFFEEQTPQSIVKSIRSFEELKNPFEADEFKKNIEKFSIQRFRKEFKTFLNINGFSTNS